MPNKRSKSLKSMTVSELVKERQKHSDRINKIDEILTEATKALGQRVVDFNQSSFAQSNSIGATSIPNNRRSISQTAPISLQAPSVQPIGYGTKEDIAPAFSLFDAETDARMRSSSEDQTNEDYSQQINDTQLKKEAFDLREQLAQELNTINNIPVPEPTEKQPEDS